MKQQRFTAIGQFVFDSKRRASGLLQDEQLSVAHATSKTLAKRIANALNIYKPKRRMQPHDNCFLCGCAVAKGERICGECACEDDSE